MIILKRMPDCRYIPYVLLFSSPITLYFNGIPVTLCLHGPSSTSVSVPNRFKLTETALCFNQTAHTVPVGTSFVLEYKGSECEVHIGKRIVSVEGGRRILL